MAEKKQDFVVSDRRRFGGEGELREEAPREEQQPESGTPAPTPKAAAPDAAAATEELPPPPTEAEQQNQREEYQASGKKIDELISSQSGGQPLPAEMSFERLVESFYMTALIQLGAVRPEGETPRVDIIGARQTIDSLTILNEKTKGNLNDREQTLLQNVLFELRMAWIEITNAIAHAQTVPGAPAGGKK